MRGCGHPRQKRSSRSPVQAGERTRVARPCPEGETAYRAISRPALLRQPRQAVPAVPLLRGALAALVAVLVAAGVTMAIELPGGSNPGHLALPGTSASHASTATPSAGPRLCPRRSQVSRTGPRPGSSVVHAVQGTAVPSTPPPAQPSVTASPAPSPSTSAPPGRSYAVPALLGAPNWNGYCEETGQGPVTLEPQTTLMAGTARAPRASATTPTRSAPGPTGCLPARSRVRSRTSTTLERGSAGRPTKNSAHPTGTGTARRTAWGRRSLQNNAYGWYRAESGNGLDAGTVSPGPTAHRRW